MSASSYSEPKEDKVLPFFDPGEEEFLESQGLKDRIINEDGEEKAGLTARDMFGKWGDEPSRPASYQSVKEKSRRDAEEEEAVDDAEEELYRSRKHSSKKEEKSKKKEKKEKTKRSLTPPSTSKEKERPLFPGAFPAVDQSPPHRLSASRQEFELKMSSLEEMPRYALRRPPEDYCSIAATINLSFKVSVSVYQDNVFISSSQLVSFQRSPHASRPAPFLQERSGVPLHFPAHSVGAAAAQPLRAFRPAHRLHRALHQR